jgi:4-nitrophenyl phosphatase
MLHSDVFLSATIYVFDLDGVMYLGDTPIPYATQAVERLQNSGKRVYFLTNNSGKTREAYQTKLRDVNDLAVGVDQIYTSAYATSLFLRDHRNAAGKTVFVIGEPGLAQELEQTAGLKTVVAPFETPSADIDFVVVGIDRNFTYEKLRYAHEAITRGRAEFIATNRDSTFPMEHGEIPGGGSIVASVACATGREPLTIGKPEPHAYEAILEAASATATDSVMIGDRLDTDIAVGNRAGAHTVLVLTGVTARDAVSSAPEEWRPEFVLDDLRQLN